MDLTNALPLPVKYTCTGCKEELLVRTQALCRSVACGGCGSAFLYDAGMGTFTFKRKNRGSLLKPYILPGDEGVLFGRRYMVTGWVAKREPNGYWLEYHLFNPVHGFAQLSTYEGHWTFHEQMRVYPRATNINRTLIFERNVYEPYNHYSCTVLAAGGEFTHDVELEERAKVRELVSPPYMLTRELDEDELAWYLGKYVEPSVIREAFAKKADPPQRRGVGACQPMKMAMPASVLRNISIAALFIFLITQLVLSMASRPRVLLDRHYEVVPRPADFAPIESGVFHLDGFRNSVQLSAHADVSNNWFELAGALINDSTGESRSFTFNIEYYSGYEGGEHWSEGGTDEGIVFSALPAGDYHLEMYPAYDRGRPMKYVSVKVQENVTLWSNFFLLLLLALVFPLYIWWRVNNFEAQRWGE